MHSIWLPFFFSILSYIHIEIWKIEVTWQHLQLNRKKNKWQLCEYIYYSFAWIFRFCYRRHVYRIHTLLILKAKLARMEATDSASSSPEKSPAHEDDDMMSSLDDSYLESYGFNFQDTYRHVLKFYKGTHLKAF